MSKKENAEFIDNLYSVTNKLTNKGKEIFNNVSSMMGKKSDEGQLVEIIIFMMIGLVLVVFVFWAYGLTSLQTRECQKLDQIYSTNNSYINPIAIYNPYSNNPIATYSPVNKLYDPSGGNARVFSYYIKTAYNCCSPGNFSNSFVSLCALRHCISLGARCLDFEVYSLNLEPIVSTTTQSSELISSFYIKETFNKIDLKDVLYYIKYFALESSNGGAPNHEDPLFLHFRIMTSQTQTINLIAKYLRDIIGDKLLGSAFGQNNYGEPLSNAAIMQFCGKCVVMVNNNTVNSSIITTSELWPLTNIFTGSEHNQFFKYSTIKHMNDDGLKTLQTNNKIYMSMVIPDTGNESTNYDPRICLKTGCQFIAMNFQTFDSNLETYFSVFAEVGYSFILKPCSLRYVPKYYLLDTTGTNYGLGCNSRVSRGGIEAEGGASSTTGGASTTTGGTTSTASSGT